MHLFKHYHESELKKLKKDELIEELLRLQGYTLTLEKAINEQKLGLVRVSHNYLIVEAATFLPELLALVVGMGVEGFGEVSTRSENWRTIDGKIRPNIDITGFSSGHESASTYYSKPVLLPKKTIEQLELFFKAFKAKSRDLCKLYEERGQNFLIQQAKKDLLGEATK